MRTGIEILQQDLRKRLGEVMTKAALDADPTEACAMLGERIVLEITNAIGADKSAFDAANQCDALIPRDDIPRWGMFYRLAAEAIAEREKIRAEQSGASAPVPA